jgi:hypothetical protein
MGAAAAIIIRKEKEIVRAFRNAGATTAAKSMSTSELGVDERVPFQILRRRQVLCETAPGRYYLDEMAWRRAIRRRKRLVITLLVAVILAAVATAYVSRQGAAGAHF